jgi:FO synthase
LRAETAAADRELVERLAVGPSYARRPERWLDAGMRAAVRRASDAAGLAFVGAWHAGAGDAVPADAAAWLAPIGESPRVASMAGARLLHRAARGDSLSEDEVVALFQARGEELHALLQAADRLRRETCGDTITFVINRNINYTNICTYKCGFCAFSKGRGSHAGRPIFSTSKRSRGARWKRAPPAPPRFACRVASIPPIPGRRI